MAMDNLYKGTYENLTHVIKTTKISIVMDSFYKGTHEKCTKSFMLRIYNNNEKGMKMNLKRLMQESHNAILVNMFFMHCKNT